MISRGRRWPGAAAAEWVRCSPRWTAGRTSITWRWKFASHDGEELGVGSYYLWTYKDGAGTFLDGAQSYKLHIPAKVPAKDFWSVLVYDSLSRSELKNGQKFPR